MFRSHKQSARRAPGRRPAPKTNRTQLHVEGLEERILLTVPAQFIAKMYTEALGRIPDQRGWDDWVNVFRQQGCNQGSLSRAGQDFYVNRPEFNSLGYDNAAKLLALYRGALNREPDPVGFNYHFQRLQTGQADWRSTVDNIFSSSEFAGLAAPQNTSQIVQSICNAGNASYSFREDPVLDMTPDPRPSHIPATNWFAGGTGAQLQGVLDGAVLDGLQAGGETVYLAPKSVTHLSGPLRVPAHITLVTYGNPDTAHYALMGRLVRETHFPEFAVWVSAGAKLNHVWEDGSSSRFTYDDGKMPSAALAKDDPSPLDTDVSFNRFSNSPGGSHITVIGNGHQTVTGNLITGYANTRNDVSADGIQVSVADAVVANNQLIDFGTQVGIVVFASPERGGGRSIPKFMATPSYWPSTGPAGLWPSIRTT